LKLSKVWIAALALLLPILPGCDRSSSGPQTKRIILLTNGPDPFWDAMRAGMEAAERDFQLAKAGLRVVRDVNDGTGKSQIDKLRQYGNQTDVAAVAISVTEVENSGIANAMNDLQNQGVKVIAIDSDLDRDKSRAARFAYLGTHNLVAGQELGKAAKGVKPDGGKYATFVGIKGAANAVERIRGFAEGAGDKFTQLESLGDEMDHSVAIKNVKDALDRNPDLTVLVGIWAYNADAIVKVVQQRGLRDKMTVVVFDAAELAIQDMEDGNIDAMVVQNPYEMGYQGTKLMKALVENDKTTIHEMFPSWDPATGTFAEPDGDVKFTGLKVVYPDKGSPLDKQMFAPATEFMKLSEFKKWLVEHNLKGS